VSRISVPTLVLSSAAAAATAAAHPLEAGHEDEKDEDRAQGAQDLDRRHVVLKSQHLLVSQMINTHSVSLVTMHLLTYCIFS
jgi:hypothetical protein